jgi:hypothetical protein
VAAEVAAMAAVAEVVAAEVAAMFHPSGCAGRCRCGGFFFRRCFGCGGCGWGCGGYDTCWVWYPAWGWVNTRWSESKPPGDVSSVASEQSAQTTEVAVKGDVNIDGTRTK